MWMYAYQDILKKSWYLQHLVFRYYNINLFEQAISIYMNSWNTLNLLHVITELPNLTGMHWGHMARKDQYLDQHKKCDYIKY